MLRYLSAICLPAIGLAAAHAAAPLPRSEAARVADVAFRVARMGAARCIRPALVSGLTFQHLGQFAAADRAAVLREARLDLGPGVLAVAAGSPAEAAGIAPGDLLLAIDGRPVPPAPLDDDGFDQEAARAYSDLIDTSMRAALSARPTATLTLSRDGTEKRVALAGVAACPSRVHLARSPKTNAFADGSHVFLTTGLLAKVRSDDELAFVIAHEMAHNDLAHAAGLRAEGVPRNFTRVLGRSGRLVRETERQADRLGIALMRDAGYDGRAAISLLSRLGSGPSFLSAHDGGDARRRMIAELLAQPPAPPVRADP